MNAEIAAKYMASIVIYSKKSYVFCSLIFSWLFTYILDKIAQRIDHNDIAVHLTALVVLVFIMNIFIIIDLITGVMAAKKRGEVIKSKKWGITVTKSFGSLLYLVVALFILIIAPNNYVTQILIFAAPVLTLLKEYISIGENLEAIYGKKSYMFTLVDKLFMLLELKLFKMFEKKVEEKEEV